MFMIDIGWISIYLLLGAFTGFLAGLLGVGGGGVLVPVLTSLFLYQGIPVDNVVHMALGTSIACMVTSSFSSLRAHNAKGAVVWSVIHYMAPGIIVGSFLATYITSYLSGAYLSLLYLCIMLFVSLQMILNKKPVPTRRLSGSLNLFGVGVGTGLIAALVSMGGAFITVAYLIWHNVDFKKAIGTSAAIAFPLSIAGTLGYLINGWSEVSLERYSLGFIYLPAVIFISLASFLTTPYGVRLAHALPVVLLKKIFIALTLFLGFRMVYLIL